MKKLFLLGVFVIITSCSGPAENSSNPTERAGSYIAGAIITSAIIRAIFNE